jgi:hypothetical protein
MIGLLLTLSTTVCLASVLASPLAAQCNGAAASGTVSCTLPVVATATINAVARLSINSTTTTLTAPNAADFGASAGVTSTGPTITVMSNTGYTLTTSAASATWTGPAGTSKPSSDLKMKVGAGAVVALGQVGTSTTGTASTNYVISYNALYNWTTDKPGSYSLVVNYTLTAP